MRYLSSAVARAVAEVRELPGTDGRVRLSIPIESIQQATGLLLRLSPDVEAIEPAALRQSVLERLRQTCRLYGVDMPPRAGPT
jgi:predicted DNA-binding transcriptional regulator YafY